MEIETNPGNLDVPSASIIDVAIVRRPAGLDSLASIGAYSLVYVLGIPTTILIARAVGPAGKGVLTLVGTLVALVGLLSLGVEASLVHEGSRGGRPIRELTRAALGIASIVGPLGAFIVAGLFASMFYESIPPEARLWAYAAALTVPLLITSGYLQAIFIALGRLIEVGLLSATLALLGFFAALLVFVLELDISALLGFNLVSVAVVSGIVVVLSRSYGVLPMSKEPVRRSLRRSLLAYGVRSHLGMAVSALNNRLVILLVALWLSTTQVGFYSIAVTAAETLSLIPTFMGTMIFQRAATLASEEATQFTGLATRLTAFTLCVGALIWLVAAEPLIRLLFGSAFIPAKNPLLILLPGIVLLGLWKNLTNDLVGRGFPEVRSYTAGLSLAVSVVLVALLIPAFGIFGAALASTISYSLAFAASVVLYGRKTGVRYRDLILPRLSDLRDLRLALLSAYSYLRSRRTTQ